MAVRIIYLKKCVKCGKQDNERNPCNIIFKHEIAKDKFKRLQTSDWASVITVYLNLIGQKCPVCFLTDSASIWILGIENFTLIEINSSAQNILSDLTIMPSQNDFIECNVVNSFVIEELLANDHIQAKILNDELIISSKPNVLLPTDSWRYFGISECYCYDKNSDSFDHPYLEFRSENNKILLVEMKCFALFLQTQIFMGNNTLSLNRIRRIKDLYKIF